MSMPDPSAAPESSPGELSAPAWHSPMFNPLQRYTAGLLVLQDGRLKFTTDAGVQFDVPVSDLNNVKFGVGDSVMKVTAGDKKWRFFFAPPPGANAAVYGGGALGAAGGTAAAVSGTKAIIESRHVGKEFKAALSGKS